MARDKIDHTTITPSGPPKSGETNAGRIWWEADAKSVADSVTSCLRQLEEQERQRGAQLVRSASLYDSSSGRALYGLGAQPATVRPGAGQYQDRIAINVSQSVSDTATAKIGKNKPRPYYVTSAGNSKQQATAKKRTKFLDGVFYENQAYRLGRRAFLHACVLGDGLIKVCAENKRIKYFITTSDEVKVDELEAANGSPRQMHHMRPIDRHVLMQCFGKKEMLSSAASWAMDIPTSRPTISDMVMVRESWHLPSEPGASDGKHVITIAEGPLIAMEKWDHDYFPFARFGWGERIKGFWHQGLVEQIQPIQVWINKLLYLIHRSYEMGGSYKILMEMGSKISQEHFNALVGAVIKYSGVKPEYIVPPLVQPEVYAQMKWLIEMAFQQPGVNQLSASGQIPVGMDKASGTALRTMGDIQTDRFQTVGQNYEQFFLDLATITMGTARDMFESGEVKKIPVNVPGPRLIERLELSDVDLKDDDSSVLQMFPVSALANEPAQRKADVQDMAQAGWIDQRQAKRLMNFPDLEAENTLAGAAEDYITQSLDGIVDGKYDDGEEPFPTPESTDNPQLGFQLAQQYYVLGKRDGLEETRLELLRRYMAQCLALMQSAMPPPAATGATPQAVPAPPPVSPVLPNGAGATA